MALTKTPLAEVGRACPPFSLESVERSVVSLADFQNQPLVVMFICNHCPYVQAIEDRLIAFAQKAQKIGGAVVGICSNDPTSYPEDNFENLQQRWQEKQYGFPYLVDETQEVARTFEAVCTPDIFAYNAQHKLQYRGRLDDSWQDPCRVKKEELWEALQAIVKNQPIVGTVVPSMGCSIKWCKG